MNTEIQIKNKRNQNGVKDSANMYLIFGGEHFIQWTSDFNAGMVATYRAAGVKVRVVKDEMFICQADTEKALRVSE